MLCAPVGERVLSEGGNATDGDHLTVFHPDGSTVRVPVEVLQNDRMTSNLIALVTAIGRVEGAATLGAASDPRFPPLRLD